MRVRSSLPEVGGALGDVSAESVDQAVNPGVGNSKRTLWQLGEALLGFTRPHTMVGTFISIVSVSLLAANIPVSAPPTETS